MSPSVSYQQWCQTVGQNLGNANEIFFFFSGSLKFYMSSLPNVWVLAVSPKRKPIQPAVKDMKHCQPLHRPLKNVHKSPRASSPHSTPKSSQHRPDVRFIGEPSGGTVAAFKARDDAALRRRRVTVKPRAIHGFRQAPAV